MVFHCQRNCFDKEFATVVTSCVQSKLLQLADGSHCLPSEKKGGKKNPGKELQCFEVTFADTVFFPEGGGQPDDHGTVVGGAESAQVLRVIRRGAAAVHFLDRSFEPGSEVVQKVDWARRKDHMQQHSAQHLITAVADKKYGYATNSWYLGGRESTIELDTKTLADEQTTELEAAVNEVIADALPVSVREYERDDPLLDESIRSRGVPEDVVGNVRVVSISGLDNNTCCGTHVSNTSQLQAVKILKKEAGKQGNINITFLAGDRVLRLVSEMNQRETTLVSHLHSNPKDFETVICKMRSNLKIAEKTSRDVMKDLALAESELFKQKCSQQIGNPKLWIIHKSFEDMEFFNSLSRNVNDPEVVKVFTGGPDVGPGMLYLGGPLHIIKTCGIKVCELLEGKGGGKTVFTAKVKNLREEKRQAVYELISMALKDVCS